jgi:hypothetical protein
MVQVSTAVGGTSGIGGSGIGDSSAEAGLGGFEAMFQNMEQQATTNEGNRLLRPHIMTLSPRAMAIRP